MRRYTLSEATVFITNTSSVISTALDVLHELEAEKLTETDRSALGRCIAMLTITQDACDWAVRDIESGPEFIGGKQP